MLIIFMVRLGSCQNMQPRSTKPLEEDTERGLIELFRRYQRNKQVNNLKKYEESLCNLKECEFGRYKLI